MNRRNEEEAPRELMSGGNFKDDEMGDPEGRELMEQLLADPSHDYRTLKYGDVIDSTVMHVDRDELLVDIGSKSEGVIPAREFSTLDDEERNAIGVGSKVLVFVVQPENSDGHAVVSIDRARQEKSWRILQEQFEAGQVIGAEVVNYNKGGLLVNLDGVRGFVPASQVTEIRGGDDAQKQADMARLIGTSLQLKIIEINRHRNRLILSERQALQERRDEMKEKLIEQLREGEVRQGRVSSICDFGAFVDVGGADGLVHLSELSWSRVRHPSEVLQIGQEVDVYVLGINAEEKKIALSIKRTQAEPWSRVAAAYDVNQLVVGQVTQLANFGAFARIEDGIEGLVHVSELADARISHPRQLVYEGQDLLLRIIRIDPQRRRMGLSLRRALEATDDEVLEALDANAVELKNNLLALEIEPDPDADAEFERREAREREEREAREAEEADAESTEAIVAELNAEESGNNAMAQAFAAAGEAIAADEAEAEVADAPAETEAVAESAAEVAADTVTEAEIEADAETAQAEVTDATAEVAVAAEPVTEAADDVAAETEAAEETAALTADADAAAAGEAVAETADSAAESDAAVKPVGFAAVAADAEPAVAAEAEATVEEKPKRSRAKKAAATGVEITKVLSNPDDEEGATSEYIDIVNNTGDDVSLEGWKLADAIDNHYLFPAFTLGAGKSVRVLVAEGTDSDTELYWGRSTQILNNEGDTVNLIDADGNTVQSVEVPPSPAATSSEA